MRILVVTATGAEVGPLVAGLRRTAERGPRVTNYSSADHDVDVLVSGVGMVATASWASRVLARERYDLALNVGVCGSFDRSIEPGSVVHVVSDCLPELGAEDGDAFLTVQQLRLLDDNEHPFSGGRLVNQSPPVNATLNGLRTVDGITVNTVHGDEPSIACVTRRFSPQVESMEGAAFMYACLSHGLPFAQVRAVSNIVERRKRDAWKLPEAIGALAHTAQRILNDA
ncbi:MAG TPA: futalosine hydrolase [Vicinamibacterales bacterium]|nr:futalosine hydrolase [Vicinamibacterales bacterium]